MFEKTKENEKGNGKEESRNAQNKHKSKNY